MNLGLALKAEMVLGWQLVSRHRAPRLAALLATSLVGLLVTGESAGAAPEIRQRAVILIAGVLGAVSASRLLAQGGALAAVHRSASPWLVAPVGRLAGSLLFTALVALAAALALIGARGDGAGAVRTAFIATVYASAAGAAVMATVPALGASSAAALGFCAALAGGASPSQVSRLLETWPLVRGPAVLIWNLFPLPWRALRWLVQASSADVAVMVAWVLLGVAAAGWAAARPGEPASRSGGEPVA